jgi:hypothetical protein
MIYCPNGLSPFSGGAQDEGPGMAWRRGRISGTIPGMETQLYLPVKRFLEARGFAVKGEICGCDLVALRGDSPPVVVVGELKLSFNLDLVLQGVDRTVASDEIWLAVRFSKRGRGREQDPQRGAYEANCCSKDGQDRA